MMTPEQFIEAALALGESEGLAALDATQRWVFIVSELEVLCDMEGIDSFVDRYGLQGVQEATDAFAALGALEIAGAMQAFGQEPSNETLLERANVFITGRAGYGYDSIRRTIQTHLTEQDGRSHAPDTGQ